MKTPEQVMEAVKSLNVKVTMHSKALKELNKHIQDNETITYINDQSTLYLITLTNERLVAIKAGLLQATDVISIPLKNIQNVSLDGGLLTSEIKVSAMGVNSKFSFPRKQYAVDVQNTIISAVQKSNEQTSKPEANPLEQLEKLAALKEKGIITEAEFNEQKQKLLSSM